MIGSADTSGAACEMRGISQDGGHPPGDRKPGLLLKLFLTSFVGTDIVFKDGRYLVVYDDTKLNQIDVAFITS